MRRRRTHSCSGPLSDFRSAVGTGACSSGFWRSDSRPQTSPDLHVLCSRAVCSDTPPSLNGSPRRKCGRRPSIADGMELIAGAFRAGAGASVLALLGEEMKRAVQQTSDCAKDQKPRMRPGQLAAGVPEPRFWPRLLWRMHLAVNRHAVLKLYTAAPLGDTF